MVALLSTATYGTIGSERVEEWVQIRSCRLVDMLDAARKALSFAQGRSRQGLDLGEMETLALR